LAACEGVLLVVDAAQGVEAQTLANVYLALEQDLEIVPVINKIDLPSAHPEVVLRQVEDGIGLDISNAVFCSAKTGRASSTCSRRWWPTIPPPVGCGGAPAGAGRRLLVRFLRRRHRAGAGEGRARRVGDRIKLMATGARCTRSHAARRLLPRRPPPRRALRR
jgi:hypothetical protein